MASIYISLSGVIFFTILLLLSLPHAVNSIANQELESMLLTLRSNNYNLFSNAITTSDILFDVVSNTTSFTFFAPSDSSLFALDMTSTASIYTQTLRYHVLPRRLSMSDLRRLPSGSSLSTLLPHREVSVSRRHSPEFDFLTVDGIDVIDPGLYYGRDVAVHGLGGILNIRTQIGRRQGLSSPPVGLPPETGYGSPDNPSLPHISHKIFARPPTLPPRIRTVFPPASEPTFSPINRAILAPSPSPEHYPINGTASPPEPKFSPINQTIMPLVNHTAPMFSPASQTILPLVSKFAPVYQPILPLPLAFSPSSNYPVPGPSSVHGLSPMNAPCFSPGSRNLAPQVHPPAALTPEAVPMPSRLRSEPSIVDIMAHADGDTRGTMPPIGYEQERKSPSKLPDVSQSLNGRTIERSDRW